MPSILEQFRISQFIEWDDQKTLILNPEFQRGSVWSPAAKTFLIDTILRELPVPKVYLRTVVHPTTKKSIREVVDGQQRLRTILEFARDGFALSKRAEEFVGKKYSTLTEEQQHTFLSYPIAVDQLMNASTDDVLEVFARLNSYTVVLNPPEKRHGKYQGEFKWAVRNASRAWASFWEEFRVLSTKERVRMMDDSLTAEMVGVLIDGVKDGGQPKIDVLYKNNNNLETAKLTQVITNLNSVLGRIKTDYAPSLKGTPLLSPPHLLMLFSAVAYLTVGIPAGDLKQNEIPDRSGGISKDTDAVRDSLGNLAAIIGLDNEPPPPDADFWKASTATTHRIASRRVRFPVFVRALTQQNN